MTTSLDWPATLPLPSFDGYALQRRSPLRRTDFDVGPARQRRFTSRTPAEFPVQLEFTAWEEMIFDSWCEERAKQGAVWFNIALLSGRGLESYEARIKSGADQVDRPRNGARWVATLTLEVRNRPMLTDSDLDLLLAEDGGALLRAVAGIHHVVTTALWTEESE